MTAFSALSVPETLCSPSNCLTSIRLDFPWPHRGEGRRRKGERSRRRRRRRAVFRDIEERRTISVSRRAVLFVHRAGHAPAPC